MELTFGRFMAAVPPRNLLRYAGALIARGLEVVAKFGLYVIAARRMGGYQAGLFFLCLTWVNLVSTGARLGLERATSRHVAAELAVGDGAAAKRTVLAGVTWTALASIIAGVSTWLLARPAALLLFHQPDLTEPLRLAALILLPQSIAFTLGFTLIGLGRGVAGQMVQSAIPPLLSLLALLTGLNQAESVLTAYAASYAVCCCLGFGFVGYEWRRAFANQSAIHVERSEPLPSLWTTARPFLVIELVQSALLSMPVLVLGVFADAVAVSAFSIANRVTMMINTILLSLAMIAAPGFARHHRLGEFAELRRVNRQTRLLAMVVCVPIVAVILIVPHTLLSLLGGSFADASAALIVLSIGQIVNILLPTEDMILAMTGHGATLRRVNLQQLWVCCALCIVLIPWLGLMGAAIVTTISLIQGRIGFSRAVRQAIPEL
ncbi:MAG TPA: MATE family efflux transporter [Acetobacteraceae bacterium]|nr:MATE family efflux transporter [Acetobacteraceae bacterium]